LGDCHDVFLSGIAKIERLPGNCFRIVCYVEEEGGARRIVALKVVWPVSLLASALRQCSEALAKTGYPMIAEDGGMLPVH
jgi:hypothetical protein